ncbi:MAG: type IV pilus twitching motility protein PilT [Acidobacteria bacterium]|nr:type IV pilus twitching motility protein PilT [Acidobacteriota bacterium]
MAGIDSYLTVMTQISASDLHLCSGVRPTYRVHGVMKPTSSEKTHPVSADEVARLLLEFMPERNRREFETHNDTDFAYEIAGVGRFRVNAFCDRNGVGAVFRHIPEKVLSFEQLGLGQVFADLCLLNKGLVLVTGPTGSGKSTTLAAMIDYINENRTDHIVTIEDPIEFVHTNKRCLVNQREVHRHTEGFKAALRAALRQDPDVVLVGEMRDLETTETAIETAETGHLVFGTLHTSSAASTIDRVIDQFSADRQAQIRMMLSVSLKGVISQTLLKRADGGGRVAAFEILVVTPAVANQIREGKSHQIPMAIQTGAKLGMRSLSDDLMRLVKERKVDPLEAYRKCVDKSDMENRLRVAGFGLNLS